MAENPEAESGKDADADLEASEQPAEVPAQVAPAENRRARRAAASSKNKDKDKDQPRGTDRSRPGPRPGSLELGGLDATERVDDAFSRAADGGVRFLKKNFNVFQWLIVASIAGWIGFQIYTWRSDKTGAKVSDLLADAVAAQLGKTGSPDDEGKRDARGSLDARRVFATDEARLAAASAGYKKVADERPGTNAAGLAKLGLAGVLYDQGKYADAQKLYEEVLGSELAKADPESRGRSIEGIALALEAKDDKDGALKRYQELENAEISGFRELALYQEGRLLHAKGDDPAAVEKLKKVLEKFSKEKKGPLDPPNYLLEISKELLQRIDPKSVPAPSADEALQNALEAFQKKLPAGVTQLPTPSAP